MQNIYLFFDKPPPKNPFEVAKFVFKVFPEI